MWTLKFNVTYFAIENRLLWEAIADVINIIAVWRIIRLSKHLEDVQTNKKENRCRLAVETIACDRHFSETKEERRINKKLNRHKHFIWSLINFSVFCLYFIDAKLVSFTFVENDLRYFTVKIPTVIKHKFLAQ